MRRAIKRVVLALALVATVALATAPAHSDEVCFESDTVVHVGPACVPVP